MTPLARFCAAALFALVAGSSAVADAGQPMPCAPLDFVPADKSIRNVVEPGEIVVRSTDRLILVNQERSPRAYRKVIFGRATNFRDAVTVKDCSGTAGTDLILITGRLDVGNFTIDGNYGTATFHPVGETWVLK